MNRRHLPLLFAAAIAFPQLAAAQESPRPNPPRIVVVGEGEAAIAPDMAILTLAVLREADTAREALDDANKAMAEVIASLKEAGVEARDIQTSGVQINPKHVYPSSSGGDQQPRIVGYQVSNNLTVRVRDVAALGAIIDRAVTLGVNQGGSITFANDDPSAATTEARKRAVRDAIERATTLAEAAGVGLGPIVELSEQSQTPPPVPFDGRAYRMEAAPASVPVEAGENTYRIQVTVTFELKQQAN